MLVSIVTGLWPAVQCKTRALFLFSQRPHTSFEEVKNSYGPNQKNQKAFEIIQSEMWLSSFKVVGFQKIALQKMKKTRIM